MFLSTTLSEQQIVSAEMQRPLAQVEENWGEQAQPAERSQGETGGVAQGTLFLYGPGTPAAYQSAALGNCAFSSNLRAESGIQHTSPNLSLNVSSLSMLFSHTTRTQLWWIIYWCWRTVLKKIPSVVLSSVNKKELYDYWKYFHCGNKGNWQHVPCVCCLCPTKGLNSWVLRAGTDRRQAGGGHGREHGSAWVEKAGAKSY